MLYPHWLHHQVNDLFVSATGLTWYWKLSDDVFVPFSEQESRELDLLEKKRLGGAKRKSNGNPQKVRLLSFMTFDLFLFFK
jgi:hypothetical protein